MISYSSDVLLLGRSSYRPLSTNFKSHSAKGPFFGSQEPLGIALCVGREADVDKLVSNEAETVASPSQVDLPALLLRHRAHPLKRSEDLLEVSGGTPPPPEECAHTDRG